MSTTQPDNLHSTLPEDELLEDDSNELSGEPSLHWRWFWLATFVAIAPLLVPYFLDLWKYKAYHYFPFAIVSVVVLAYARSDGKFYPPRGWLGWVGVGLAVLCVLFGALVQFPWFSAVALVMLSASLLFTMRGEEDDSLLALVLPLATVIQLVRLDLLLVRRLQEVTTWLSSVLLDMASIPHAVRNNVIQLSDRELFVAEACSGVQSVFTLAFLACLMVAWRRRRLWMTPIYLGIACLLAVFANVIRVTTVALAATLYEADIASGWTHDLLGYIALAIAAGFLLSFDHLIATLWHRVPLESEYNPLTAGWNYLALRHSSEDGGGRGTQRDTEELFERDRSSRVFQLGQKLSAIKGVQIGFGVLVGLIFIVTLIPVLMSRKPVTLVMSEKALVFDPSPELFDDSLEVLSVKSHYSNRGYQNPRLGANSDIWECEWEDIQAQFVLSQPHTGWHELCNCYERLDWMLLDRDIRQDKDFERLELTAETPEALEASYVVARFKRPPTEFGYLVFAGIGSNGELLEAPDSFSAFTHRIWNRIDTAGVWDQSEVIMLQMWVASRKKLSSKEIKELEEEFVMVRERCSRAIIDNSGVKSAATLRPSRYVSQNPKVASFEIVRVGSKKGVN